MKLFIYNQSNYIYNVNKVYFVCSDSNKKNDERKMHSPLAKEEK